MKKTLFTIALSVTVTLLSSCGSSQKVADNNYYNNPNPVIQNNKAKEEQIIEKKREQNETYKLAAEPSTRLRAVGVGNDFDEHEAIVEALENAGIQLASFMEQAIISFTQRYHEKTQVNVKKMSEAQRKNYAEIKIAQKITSKPIGSPEIFDLSDGSIRVYHCVELSVPTDQILGEVYDELKKDKILEAEYSKQLFIKETNEILDELRAKVTGI